MIVCQDHSLAELSIENARPTNSARSVILGAYVDLVDLTLKKTVRLDTLEPLPAASTSNFDPWPLGQVDQ